MMKKRTGKLMTLIALVTAVSMLAACGNAGASAASSAAKSEPQSAASEAEQTSLAPAAGGDVLELKLSHNNAATTDTGKEIQAWADKVNEASGGTIHITIYPSDSLGATNTFLDMLDTGITDLQWASTVFCPGQFNYLDAFGLPMIGISDCESGSQAFWDVYEQYPEVFEEEFKDYFPLIMYSSVAGVVGSNMELHTVSDFNGKTIRTAGSTCADYMSLLGANPAAMGPGDVYTSIEKNVIDGYMFEWSGIDSFNLDEVTKYYVDADMYRTILCIWITRDLWDSLTDEQRAAFESVSYREGSKPFADMYQAQGDATIQKVIDEGKPIYYPTDAEYAEYFEKAQALWENWSTSIQTLGGVDPLEYLDSVRAALEKYAD